MKGEDVMDLKKRLIINCDVCDTRKMQENAYEKYDAIIINSDIVLVNGRSKALMGQMDIICNADEFIELEDDDSFDVSVVSVNGRYSIGSAPPAEENVILGVNGSLKISPGAEETLKHYYRISVNGSVLCPESAAPYLSRMSVNGSVAVYPDDYTVLNDNFVIDKYFPLRAAKDGKYFVRGTVKLTDKTVNTALLAEKNVRFKAKKLLVPEEKIEECAALFDERAEFVVVPRGFETADGNMTLNNDLIKKYGKKIFVSGDLDARGDISEAAEQIDKIIVTGKVTVTRRSKEIFDKTDAEYKDIKIVKETVLRDKPIAKIDKNSLRLSEDGISAENCGIVKIAKDISPEEIMELIDMKNVGVVMCSEEQVSAAEAVGENIGKVTTEIMDDVMSVLKGVIGGKVINSDKYVM